MYKKILSIIFMACVFQLGGCATNARPEQMTAANPVVAQKPHNTSLLNNITVTSVTGGEETNPLGVSKINNEGFRQAIEDSLRNARLYNDSSRAKYNLDVALISLKQPFWGGDLTVVCQTHYKLWQASSNKILFDKDITASYTAKMMQSSVYAVNRLKMANEGAARANISEFIREIYQLPVA